MLCVFQDEVWVSGPQSLGDSQNCAVHHQNADFGGLHLALPLSVIIIEWLWGIQKLDCMDPDPGRVSYWLCGSGPVI
jgi:hypothetical protein